MMALIVLADFSVNDILAFIGGVIDMLGLRPFIYGMFVIVMAGLLLVALIKVSRGS